MAVALLSCARFSNSLEDSLFGAVCRGDLSKAEELLRRGANVNVTDADGHSPLIVAESCTTRPGSPEMVKLLIANGAEVSLQARDGSTALMYAAKNSDVQAVKALLKSGASVNIADKDGETALMKAVNFSCDQDTIRALIEAGADLKATNHKGRSALSSTCLTVLLPEELHLALEKDDKQRHGRAKIISNP